MEFVPTMIQATAFYERRLRIGELQPIGMDENL